MAGLGLCFAFIFFVVSTKPATRGAIGPEDPLLKELHLPFKATSVAAAGTAGTVYTYVGNLTPAQEQLIREYALPRNGWHMAKSSPGTSYYKDASTYRALVTYTYKTYSITEHHERK